jgi:hypothetical protein
VIAVMVLWFSPCKMPSLVSLSLRDRQRSRADFGTSRSSSSSDPSGLPSGGAFARQFADSIAVVQHILDDVLTNANDFDQQERVIKDVLWAKSSLLVHCLTKPPQPPRRLALLLWQNCMPSTMLLQK